MREILNDGQRILSTLRMIDERYAKWGKAEIWEELEAKFSQQNKNEKIEQYEGENIMDDLHEKSALFSTMGIEENDFVKLVVPLAAYEIDTKFFLDGWQPDHFMHL